MSEKGLTRNQIIQELAKSPHGNLAEYADVGLMAAKHEPEFFAHLIAWNHAKGQIRDAKVALPVLALTHTVVVEWEDNAQAALATLSPRDLLRAYRYMIAVNRMKILADHSITLPKFEAVGVRPMRRLIERYLRHREAVWPRWERMASQHRRSVKELYALASVKPSPMANEILFKGAAPEGSIFAAIKQLPKMSPAEAAGAIMEHRIPFLIALGALQLKAYAKDQPASAGTTELLMALISRMSPTELVGNTKLLETYGLKQIPALRAAYENGLKRVATSKKTTFKATQAAAAVKDEGLRAQLEAVQEKQIKALGGIDGDWLVLGDKSGSMAACIETARHVAATLAKMVNGKVHLVFFDTQPTYVDASGLAYDKLLEKTKSVGAAGGTSIGVGVRYVMERDLNVDGIVIVSDGCENQVPRFAQMYGKLAEKLGKEPPVYFYHVSFGGTWAQAAMANLELKAFGESLKVAGIDVQVFELGATVDYYSLPNLAQTMRVRRFGLADEILETPLLKLADVLPLEVSA